MRLSKIDLALTLLVAASLRSARAFIPTSMGRQSRTAFDTFSQRQQSHLFLLDKLFGTATSSGKLPVIAEESVMSQKAHGTSEKPVQKNLRWNCDYDTADRICNFNRHYAEYAGYWTTTDFLKWIKENYTGEPIKFYDSVTGKLLFTAPVGRSMEDFL